MSESYIPILREKTSPFPSVQVPPAQSRTATVTEQAIRNLGPNIERQHILKLDPRPIAYPLHLLNIGAPSHIVREQGNEFPSFGTDLRPRELGYSLEEGDVEGDAALDLGGKGMAVLVADGVGRPGAVEGMHHLFLSSFRNRGDGGW